jgi:hypothetical protein
MSDPLQPHIPFSICVYLSFLSGVYVWFCLEGFDTETFAKNGVRTRGDTACRVPYGVVSWVMSAIMKMENVHATISLDKMSRNVIFIESNPFLQAWKIRHILILAIQVASWASWPAFPCRFLSLSLLASGSIWGYCIANRTPEVNPQTPYHIIIG